MGTLPYQRYLVINMYQDATSSRRAGPWQARASLLSYVCGELRTVALRGNPQRLGQRSGALLDRHHRAVCGAPQVQKAMHLTCMRAPLLRCVSAVLSIHYLNGAIYIVYTCLYILACTRTKWTQLSILPQPQVSGCQMVLADTFSKPPSETAEAVSHLHSTGRPSARPMRRAAVHSQHPRPAVHQTLLITQELAADLPGQAQGWVQSACHCDARQSFPGSWR